MGKKLLPFFSKPTNAEEPAPPLWPWPAYCQQPRTLSFRDINDPFETSITSLEEVEPISRRGTDPVEEVIKGLIRSERLFFEPEETSSILDEANSKQIAREERTLGVVVPFKESVAMSMESQDPYLDFKKSMEEMVEAHGMKDSWEELQELLCCYLRVNGKANHGYILGAFVDLLVGFAFASSSSSSSSSKHECPCSCSRNSPSSPLSLYTSSSSCSASSCSSSSYECSSSSNPRVSSSEISDVVSPCLSLVGVEIAILEEEEEEEEEEES